MLGYGGLGLGVWGLFWAWAGLFWARAGYAGIGCGGFGGCVFGGLGWGRLGLQVGGLFFWGRWVAFGHGGLGYRIGGGDMGWDRQILGFGWLIGPGHKKLTTSATPQKQ